MLQLVPYDSMYGYFSTDYSKIKSRGDIEIMRARRRKMNILAKSNNDLMIFKKNKYDYKYKKIQNKNVCVDRRAKNQRYYL